MTPDRLEDLAVDAILTEPLRVSDRRRSVGRITGPPQTVVAVGVFDSFGWEDLPHVASGLRDQRAVDCADFGFRYPVASLTTDRELSGDVEVYDPLGGVLCSLPAFERLALRFLKAVSCGAVVLGDPTTNADWWPRFEAAIEDLERRVLERDGGPPLMPVVDDRLVDAVTVAFTSPASGLYRNRLLSGPHEMSTLIGVLCHLADRCPARLAESVRDRQGFGADEVGVSYPEDGLWPGETAFDGVDLHWPMGEVVVSLPAFERLIARFFRAFADSRTGLGHQDTREPWWPEFVAATEEIERRVASQGDPPH